jgi:uncharacterized protein YjbJ (UPF0337 family)
MKSDFIEHDWKQLREKIMARWDNLSAEGIDQIAGRRDQWVARIQEAYGISKEEAEAQIKAFEATNTNYRRPDAT